jgi:hypothetical protein
MPTYNLVDAEELSNLLEIPSRDERQHIPDGYWVGLGFKTTKKDQEKFPVDIEILFVQVESREEGTNIFYGKLGSKPEVCSGVRIGDDIQFESRHVMEIIPLWKEEK